MRSHRGLPRHRTLRICAVRAGWYHIRQALQHVQLISAMRRRGWPAEHGQRPKNLPIGAAHRHAGKRSASKPPKRDRLPLDGVLLVSGTITGPSAAQHQLEYALAARQLAHWLAPVRFDPHAALVGKTQQHRIGLKVLGRQPCDRVVSWPQAPESRSPSPPAPAAVIFALAGRLIQVVQIACLLMGIVSKPVPRAARRSKPEIVDNFSMSMVSNRREFPLPSRFGPLLA